MYKKIIKGIIICVSVAFFIVIICCVTYLATLNILNRAAADNPNTAEAVASRAIPETAEESAASPEPSIYYIAKLNGDKIEIYQCGGSETAETPQNLLYSFKVYRAGIPDEDISGLTRGIIFKTREELASFEEDFNS